MRRIEIKSISLGSIFKIFGAVSLIGGLISGLSFGLIGGAAIKFFMKDVPYVQIVSPGVASGLVLGMICGLIGGATWVIIAFIYNLFAGIVGGIKIDIEE